MDIFKVKASAKPVSRLERPGYEIFIGGSLLKPGSETWDETHREHGIWLRFVYPTSSEEEGFLLEAQQSGNAANISLIQVYRSIVAVALGDKSEEGESKLGTWQRLEKADVRPFWEELGPLGRAVAVQAFQLASIIDEKEARKAIASFRTRA